MLPAVLDLTSLRNLYATRTIDPVAVMDLIASRIAASADPAIFISTASPQTLKAEAEALIARSPEPNSLPLWGIPYAIKDNIDAVGFVTTAACPAYSYTPDRDAEAVARLREAGAIIVGKTNLDQFATGLNGTRSPYGAPRSVFNASYISGGSSSGSAVAVASGLCVFALGTDTAGSGRVPAAFNNIVGIKPTPGLVSTSGLVPACRTLDCITVFSANTHDGVTIRKIIEGFDPKDTYSRRAVPLDFAHGPIRAGVLTQAERVFHGDLETERLYEEAIARLEHLGAVAVPFDYTPFREIASLLYDGPWVAERLAATESFFASHAADIDPSVRSILQSAARFTAVDAFQGRYKLEAWRRRCEAAWAQADVLLLPTAPCTYTVAEMRAEPVRLNSNLGRYTNFTNLLGLAAIAVPAGFKRDGLPAGITLIGPAWSDDALAPLADALHRASAAGMGIDTKAAIPPADWKASPATPRLEIAVAGAHLDGLALNHELRDLGGTLVRTARTAGDYKLFALAGTVPAKPGLIRVKGFDGAGIEIEIWSLPLSGFARFTEAIPAPLGIAKIALSDGGAVSGFVCESYATGDAQDITHYGGWRGYLAANNSTDEPAA